MAHFKRFKTVYVDTLKRSGNWRVTLPTKLSSNLLYVMNPNFCLSLSTNSINTTSAHYFLHWFIRFKTVPICTSCNQMKKKEYFSLPNIWKALFNQHVTVQLKRHGINRRKKNLSPKTEVFAHLVPLQDFNVAFKQLFLINIYLTRFYLYPKLYPFISTV